MMTKPDLAGIASVISKLCRPTGASLEHNGTVTLWQDRSARPPPDGLRKAGHPAQCTTGSGRNASDHRIVVCAEATA